MARKPVATYAGGKGPRQKIWEAIRTRRDSEWTRDDIAMGAGVDAETLSTYLQALRRAGVVAETRKQFYRLVNDEGVEAPRLRRDGSRVTQGLAQEQMWRTLRMMPGDTNARELAAHASTPVVPVKMETAHSYLKALKRAGYLVTTLEGKSTGVRGKTASSRYRLRPTCNTGPRPPMICRAKTVYDPNLGQVVWQASVSEEDAIYG